MYLGETNWDAVGATAEALGVIGVIGVIVTLIYLIRQIKQNTAATRSTAMKPELSLPKFPATRTNRIRYCQ